MNGIRGTSEVGGFPFRVLDSEKEVFWLALLILLLSFGFFLFCCVIRLVTLFCCVCVRLLLCVSRHAACIPCMHLWTLSVMLFICSCRVIVCSSRA